MSTSSSEEPGPRGSLPIRLRAAVSRWLGRRRDELSLWGHVQAFPALAVWGGLDCVAAMILAQRALGGSALKLNSSQLGLTATGAAALALLGRALLARFEERRPAAWMRAVAACAAAGPIVTLLLGTSRRVSWGNAGLVGSLALGVALASWLWSREFIERLLAAFLTTPRKPSGMVSADALRSLPLPDRHRALSIAPADDETEPTLWIRRRALPGGDDLLEGAVFVDFAAGQGVATVHISFCPAFARAPRFLCDVRDAPDVRVKGTAIYPYGCRIELKRGGALTNAARIEVRFSASQASQSTRAA